MKKETIMVIVGLIIISILLGAIAVLMNPGLLGAKPHNPTDNQGIENEDGSITQPIDNIQQQKDIANCPSSLAVYYSVDRLGTSHIIDDIVYLWIKNNDARDYQVAVTIDSVAEGNILAKAATSSNITSNQLTAWWREQSTAAGNSSARKTFSIDLSIEGCSRTTAELVPTATIMDKQGGGGDGPSGGSDAGPGSIPLEIIEIEKALPD